MEVLLLHKEWIQSRGKDTEEFSHCLFIHLFIQQILFFSISDGSGYVLVLLSKEEGLVAAKEASTVKGLIGCVCNLLLLEGL